MKVRLQGLLWLLIGLLVGLLLLGGQPRVHALPEYATRTGEPCATCHVNPAGGGPRTPRGALWLAQGRPDLVPQLPGSVAPAEENPAPAKDKAPAGESALPKRQAKSACGGAPASEATFPSCGGN